MPIPRVYTEAPRPLINFNFDDILSDVGYITVYGVSDENDDLTLLRSPIESTEVYSDVPVSDVTTPETAELNFDMTFNISQKVKGVLYVTATISAVGASGYTVNNDTTIEIFHVDSGASETSIGTQQSIRQLSVVGTTQEESRHTLAFDVDKFFAKGDKLRVEVVMTATSSGTGSGDIKTYHDGANRNLSLTDQWGAAADSNLIVNIPFPLDI